MQHQRRSQDQQNDYKEEVGKIPPLLFSHFPFTLPLPSLPRHPIYLSIAPAVFPSRFFPILPPFHLAPHIQLRQFEAGGCVK